MQEGRSTHRPPGPHLHHQRGLCHWLLWLPCAPGVGDSSLTGLLSIQTHLELTSESHHQHLPPHRSWLLLCCPMAEFQPSPQPQEQLSTQDAIQCSEGPYRTSEGGLCPQEQEGSHMPQADATGHTISHWEGVPKDLLPRLCPKCVPRAGLSDPKGQQTCTPAFTSLHYCFIIKSYYIYSHPIGSVSLKNPDTVATCRF